jgi:5-methyltetrahydrofolate--homocysteine methyltransferase
LQIINEHIIPALDVVGDGFEKNKVFLPQLLMSADAAKSAFDVIKEKLRTTGQQKKSPHKIVLATVHGDIHDIGKNIVKVLLENYGFDVLDLGKDVPEETVLQAVQDNNATLVGLSALMTTTVPAMERTIELVHKNTNAKVIVGGAVLTRSYAEMIHADHYAKDAMETVRLAKAHFGIE